MDLSSTKRLLVTAALPYANGDIHIGHIAGAYLPADIYVRYKRLRGVDVRFICGSDDYGVAIMLRASAEGRTPAEVAKEYHASQKAAFGGLGIHFDVYGSTSRNAFHTATSQDFFTAIYSKGYFEKQESRQFYDDSRGMFLPDRFVKGTCVYCGAADQNGDQCENCGKMLDVDSLQKPRSVVSGDPASIKSTWHWFLDLSRFQNEVARWLEGVEVRETTKKYVQGLLGAGLIKRAMTRDIDWGVPVPLDDPDAKGKVLYVWFDAPIGYISNTKQLCTERNGNPESYVDWWKSSECDIVHFIGEDNTIFHCVIWIAMLAAEGTYRLPRGVVINQFLNIQFPGREVEKISKSRGTALWLKDYIAAGENPDTLRYYLTCIAPERARTTFKPDDMLQRHNSELANILGNFVNRIVAFTHRYVGPEVPAYLEEKVSDRDREFTGALQKAFEEATALLEECNFRAALELLMEAARTCNRYVDEKAPWATRKTDLEVTKVTLAYALRAIKFFAITLKPFLPFTADKIAGMLNLDSLRLNWGDALRAQPAGAPLKPAEILFAKLETSIWLNNAS